MSLASARERYRTRREEGLWCNAHVNSRLAYGADLFV